MRKAILLLFALLLLSSCTQQPLTQDYKCPDCNVILISIDTLRADHLGCYGYERNTSPNIDRFAKDSVLFEKDYSAAPWTLPSHASIFTSLYPSQHGAHAIPGTKTNFTNILASVPTISEILHNHSFYNVAITDGGAVSAKYGFGRGFYNYTELYPWSMNFTLHRIIKEMPNLEKQQFFMFVHTYQVHTPHTPEDRFLQVFNTQDNPLVLDFLTSTDNSRMLRYSSLMAHWKNISGNNLSMINTTFKKFLDEGLFKIVYNGSDKSIKTNFYNAFSYRQDVINLYDSDILQMDYYFGELIDFLNSSGLLSNTMIVLTADHGEEFFDYHRDGSLRAGGHFYLYNSVLRVPLIVYAPGLEASRVKEAHTSLDILPTILSILDFSRDLPFTMGRNLLLQGPDAVAITEQFQLKGYKSIATPDYKYIQRLDNGYEELYNLKQDPLETRNLAKENNLESFRRLLQAYTSRRYLIKGNKLKTEFIGNFTPAPNQNNASSQDLETLRRLGYLE